MTQASPLNTVPKDRIVSLDVIRGFAILGILLMNIQSFSMVGQAYLNPMAFGDMTGLNKWVWIVSHLFADQKFMTIFCMLFGASIILITESAERKGNSTLRTHYSRNFWLLVIGLIHAYGFWYGDILTPYALCAFLLYPLRKLSSKKLIFMGLLLFSIASLIELAVGAYISTAPKEVVEGMRSGWLPTEAGIAREIQAYTGSFSTQMQARAKASNMMHSKYFIFFFLWRICGLMLIGMALYKSTFLTGALSKQFYRKVLIITGSLGMSMVAYGIVKNFQAEWSMEYAQYFGSQYNYWGSLLVAIAYIAAVILWIKTGIGTPFISRLASVGRMALTNYLLQTIICTSIFYGFGLGLFGQVERIYQFLIVLAIWLVQLYLSPLWFRSFRSGPVEWLWRGLTAWKFGRLRL